MEMMALPQLYKSAETIVWILVTFNSGSVIQYTRPIETEFECQQLSTLVKTMYDDVETRCVKRVVKQEIWSKR